jgi:hypothetical protein
VGTIAVLVTKAQDKGVLAVLGPHGVELSCIPQSLIGNLRYPDWVRGWARASRLERFFYRVVHMRLVVGTVKVLAVPASSYYQFREHNQKKEPLTQESDEQS